AASTAPSAQSLLYWGNGGIGAAAAAWPDLANCGSSIATLF
ncbi:Os07g0508900, partial [Oryza sativa Japonica Group]